MLRGDGRDVLLSCGFGWGLVVCACSPVSWTPLLVAFRVVVVSAALLVGEVTGVVFLWLFSVLLWSANAVRQFFVGGDASVVSVRSGDVSGVFLLEGGGD